MTSYSGRRASQFQRVYKACQSCRKKKTRCVLDPSDSHGNGPCERCKRESRPCLFSLERSSRGPENWKGRKNSDSHTLYTAAAAREPSIDSAGDNTTIIENPQSFRRPQQPNKLDPLQVTEMYQGTAEKACSGGDLSALSERDGLADTVIRTFVSNENEALDLLYCAAQQRDAESPVLSMSVSNRTQAVEHLTPVTMASAGPDPASRSVQTSNVYRIWDSFRFVKMGWFTSKEAVSYMDLFFKNLAPMSPVCHGWDLSHSKHYSLVTQEPLLACTILMISARYHTLPGVGGTTRGVIIHQRLWDHCQHLIMRIIFGQEKKSKAKTRTVGALEALLLIHEWQPNAIHFPPGSDGWDSDLLLSVQDDRDDPYGNQADAPGTRWMADIVEPARMSDKMSWMLLGCAQSLAHELGLYDPNKTDIPGSHPLSQRSRGPRLAKLLYIFIEQLSTRLGCTSLAMHTQGRALPDRSPAAPDSAFLSAWIELTSLLRTISDVLFPSSLEARQILLGSRYINIIKHFKGQLLSWKAAHLKDENMNPEFFSLLSMDYFNLNIFMNSLGMQAVVDRVLQDGKSTTERQDILNSSLTSTDYEFIQEVIDGSCSVLQSVNKLAGEGTLRYQPVRIFLRVIAASIFLLKALSLGSRSSNVQSSLAILEETIQALHTSNFDDMHLASRYASLLDRHVARFRERLVPSSVPRGIPASINWSSGMWENGIDLAVQISDADISAENFQPSAEEWMSLPFDASLAPFGPTGDTLEMSEFGDNAWEFLRSWPIT
ncbi:hypothetical protein V2G26_003727 [Clonostachys chloroleuca]